jgi:hypothetical protein
MEARRGAVEANLSLGLASVALYLMRNWNVPDAETGSCGTAKGN